MKLSPRFRAAGVLAAALLVACAALAAAAPAEKAAKAAPAAKVESPAKPAAEAQHEAMMAEMMKVAAPGPQHERLKACVGKWKAVVKSWSGPGEPAVSEGLSENQMIFGGRYLEQRFTSAMMGQPFEGYGLNGYDNVTKRYWYFWVDNMSTGMMSGWGDMDEAGKTLTVTGSAAGSDGKLTEVKMVTRFVDDNTQVFTMFGKMGDQDVKMMEITYTRM